LDFDLYLFSVRKKESHTYPGKGELLSNGAGLKRNAADGLFTRPSNFVGMGLIISTIPERDINGRNEGDPGRSQAGSRADAIRKKTPF
jgi:hypothetical protein